MSSFILLPRQLLQRILFSNRWCSSQHHVILLSRIIFKSPCQTDTMSSMNSFILLLRHILQSISFSNRWGDRQYYVILLSRIILKIPSSDWWNSIHELWTAHKSSFILLPRSFLQNVLFSNRRVKRIILWHYALLQLDLVTWYKRKLELL